MSPDHWGDVVHVFFIIIIILQGKLEMRFPVSLTSSMLANISLKATIQN